MVATFVIEAVLLLYTLLSSNGKLRWPRVLIALILLNLAAFQLSEFMVCDGDPAFARFFSHAGFVGITLLPTLGAWLLDSLIDHKEYRWIAVVATVWSAYFIYRFGFEPGGEITPLCRSNYVFFDLGTVGGLSYALYYYGILTSTLMACFRENYHRHEKDKIIAVKWLGYGYLYFMVPVSLVNLVFPSTIDGIPSIMCGFAVTFALALVVKVLPATNNIKSS